MKNSSKRIAISRRLKTASILCCCIVDNRSSNEIKINAYPKKIVLLDSVPCSRKLKSTDGRQVKRIPIAK